LFGTRKTTLALAIAGAAVALATAAPCVAAETGFQGTNISLTNPGGSVPWGAGCTSGPPAGPRTSSACGASLVDGRSIPPPNAPTAVKQVIGAANQIDERPYLWGGGHVSWLARGYDCSGAVGYALHGAGLLDVTMVSGQLAHWANPGVGRWITVYANPHHVFMVVAGLRFDTRGNPPGVTGPRWHRAIVAPRGFLARHPPGL
jgi:cell wall-associated NlpC family hydrolase